MLYNKCQALFCGNDSNYLNLSILDSNHFLNSSIFPKGLGTSILGNLPLALEFVEKELFFVFFTESPFLNISVKKLVYISCS